MNVDSIYQSLVSDFEFRQCLTVGECSEYNRMLVSHYRALGFLTGDPNQDLKFLPRASSLRYGLFEGSELVGIAALNRLDRTSPTWRIIDCNFSDPNSFLELNNVVLAQTSRGVHTLPYLLFKVISEAVAYNAKYVCGVVRYEVLKHFLDVGAMPLVHEPLRVLGHKSYDDFVIYFDCSSLSSCDFLKKHVVEEVVRKHIFLDMRRKRLEQKRSETVSLGGTA